MDKTAWQNFAVKLDYTKKYVCLFPPSQSMHLPQPFLDP